ncbi:MAG TPA: hypothetical protein PLD23_03705 [Armatimonadota bacterium]|nr:hypothetical protein [Armatimonadota bacterium]
MTNAQTVPESSPAESPGLGTRAAETLAEGLVLILAAMAVVDRVPLPDGYALPMLILAGLLVVLLVARRSAGLLRPDVGMVTALGLAVLLTCAKGSRRIGEVELFPIEGFGGVPVPWAEPVGLAFVFVVVARSLLRRGQDLRQSPYAPSVLVAAVCLVAVELVLATSVRRAEATLPMDVPLAFALHTLEFAALLWLCSTLTRLGMARRLALIAVLGLVAKVVWASHGA